MLALLLSAMVSSCNSWDESDQQAWKQACMENAGKWTADQTNAQTYCDCVLEKMIRKYPNVNDALDHVADLAVDTEFYSCKENIKTK